MAVVVDRIESAHRSSIPSNAWPPADPRKCAGDAGDGASEGAVAAMRWIVVGPPRPAAGKTTLAVPAKSAPPAVALPPADPIVAGRRRRERRARAGRQC
jgi:hypothetical protein